MYDASLSKLLAQVSELTYVQYKNGPPPNNNGKITPPSGFTQIASFTAPEIDLAKFKLISQTAQDELLVMQSSADLQKRVHVAFPGVQDVYFGFALTSAKYNIIALRGTQSDFEWAVDAAILQVPVPLGWFKDGKFQVARVHAGWLFFFIMLAEQILGAAGRFNPALPCLVTGHSLGGALSVLASPVLKIVSPARRVEMYSYAGPRVGNPAFADAYNFFVPESYRVVNLADAVTIMPPTKFLKIEYRHVGQEWSFLNQSGNIGGNHALIGPANYTDAVNLGIPTDAPRKYPVTGLGTAKAAAGA